MTTSRPTRANTRDDEDDHHNDTTPEQTYAPQSRQEAMTTHQQRDPSLGQLFRMLGLNGSNLPRACS
ncbi:hypothetical protein PIB30_093670, partial [Stylosanthes scabra]|nr:hypothetical protein [Stylosanthes scabra]